MEKSKVYKVIWILLLSIVFTIDSALFGDDHVPYWAYLIKFVVMASLLTLGQKAMSSGDAETVKDKQRSLLLLKLIQLLGKSICVDRWKIRENMLFSLVFLAYRDQSYLGTLNKLP